MSDYRRYLFRVVAQMFILLVVSSVSAWLYGRYDMVWGIVTGWIGSLLYLLMMAHRIWRCAHLPAKQAISSMRVGWVIRLLLLVMVLIICIRYPAIHLLSAIIALFALHILLYGYSMVLVIKQMIGHDVGK